MSASQPAEQHGRKYGFFASRANLVLLGFLAIGGFFLLTEHSAHVIPYLPWLLLAACPLMHVFMHGGHGGHAGHGGGGDAGAPSDKGAAAPHHHEPGSNSAEDRDA